MIEKWTCSRCLDWGEKKPAELQLSGVFCRDVISHNLEKHFCLTSTTLYVSSVHVFSHLYLTTDFLFGNCSLWKQKKKNSFGLCILMPWTTKVFFLLFRMFIQLLRISPSHFECHVVITHLFYCFLLLLSSLFLFNVNHTIRFTLAFWGTITFWDPWGFDVNKE